MSENARAAASASEPPQRLHGLLVEFEDVERFKTAAARVAAAGYRRWDTHSPFPVHGMDEAMGIRPTRLPWLVLLFGAIGLTVGLTMQWWMNGTRPDDFRAVPTFLQGFDFHISGKPLWSLPANIPIIFEFTVLLAALAAAIGMFVMNGMPRWHHALFAHPRFRRVTCDRFFLYVEANDPLFNETQTSELLGSLGGSAMERVYQPPRTAVPRWVLITGVVILCALLFPPILAFKARVSLSSTPRINIVPDMDNQDRYKSQQANPVFADGRAMRPQVVGTIARSDEWALGDDPHYYEGRVNGEWATTFPPRVEISKQLLKRGQQRFNIYCSVCHGLDGSGNGMVAQRVRDKPTISSGWVPPASLHEPVVLGRPVGHIFNTITNGIRTMPPYGDQIPVADRWAIVAYVRALQRSENARLEEIPADQRADLR